MPKFFVNNEQIKKDEIKIYGQDAKHIIKVLRHKLKDEINVCNIDNSDNYKCIIREINEESIICKIQEIIKNKTESNIEITIFQGLPKSDKMELIIQKSVELGVYDITPIEMERCIVKLNQKDKEKKICRWQKISEVAAKQSGRNIIPKINEIKTIKNICQNIQKYDIVLVAYEQEKEYKLKKCIEKIKQINKDKIRVGIVIGPEGGFTEAEIKELKESGANIITLGNRILRTETVALNMISIVMYELEG